MMKAANDFGSHDTGEKLATSSSEYVIKKTCKKKYYHDSIFPSYFFQNVPLFSEIF